MDAGGSRRLQGRWLPWLALCLAATLAMAGCSSNRSVAPPHPPGDSATEHEVSAQRTLSDLVAALESRSVSDAAALATSSARSALEVLVANAQKLDLRDVSMRLVDDQSALSAADREHYGEDAWSGIVQLGYRVGDWDGQATRLETRFVFVTADGRARIAGIGGGDSRTPLWTAGPVTAVAAGRTLVITTGSDEQRYLELAKHALADVGKVLSDWRGHLVIEVPATEDQLDQALAAPKERYANIAAVTATVDGSLTPGSPVHVFLNPAVFDALGPRGAQVVVSHETTHVATDATFAQMPTWLLEGFADYVALAHAGIPVGTAGSQILARIRKEGPPDHLPTATELDPTANGLGATYEEAWLATRFIAREYGEEALLTFYRRVGAGEAAETAFRRVLGTSETVFVDRWRDDLRDLSGGVAG